MTLLFSETLEFFIIYYSVCVLMWVGVGVCWGELSFVNGDDAIKRVRRVPLKGISN